MGASFTDEGITIKCVKLGETDRISTVLTRKYGKVSCVVKGARKTNSKNSAALSVFARSDLKFTLGKSLAIINESQLVDGSNDVLCSDYDKYLAASQICNLSDKLTPYPFEPSENLYLLLVRALKMLTSQLPEHITPNLVALSFTLRSLTYAGYEVNPEDYESTGLIFPSSFDENTIQSTLESLLSGNWNELNQLMESNVTLESALTKAIAHFAVQHTESRLNAYNYSPIADSV